MEVCIARQEEPDKLEGAVSVVRGTFVGASGERRDEGERGRRKNRGGAQGRR